MVQDELDPERLLDLLDRVERRGLVPLLQVAVEPLRDEAAQDAAKAALQSRLVEPLTSRFTREGVDRPQLRAELAVAAVVGVLLGRRSAAPPLRRLRRPRRHGRDGRGRPAARHTVRAARTTGRCRVSGSRGAHQWVPRRSPHNAHGAETAHRLRRRTVTQGRRPPSGIPWPRGSYDGWFGTEAPAMTSSPLRYASNQ